MWWFIFSYFFSGAIFVFGVHEPWHFRSFVHIQFAQLFIFMAKDYANWLQIIGHSASYAPHKHTHTQIPNDDRFPTRTHRHTHPATPNVNSSRCWNIELVLAHLCAKYTNETSTEIKRNTRNKNEIEFFGRHLLIHNACIRYWIWIFTYFILLLLIYSLCVSWLNDTSMRCLRLKIAPNYVHAHTPTAWIEWQKNCAAVTEIKFQFYLLAVWIG